MSAAAEILASVAEVHGFGIVPGLVWAFRIHDDGIAEALPVDQPIEHRHDGWLWLHLNLADVRCADALHGMNLPPVATALLLSHDTHQQIHVAGGCAFGVFADL